MDLGTKALELVAIRSALSSEVIATPPFVRNYTASSMYSREWNFFFKKKNIAYTLPLSKKCCFKVAKMSVNTCLFWHESKN